MSVVQCSSYQSKSNTLKNLHVKHQHKPVNSGIKNDMAQIFISDVQSVIQNSHLVVQYQQRGSMKNDC